MDQGSDQSLGRAELALTIAIAQPGRSISTVTIREFPAVIGRDTAVPISLSGLWVGRRHAEIRPGLGGFVLVDYGTLAGTMVNQHRISEYGPLKVGDVISIASWQMTVTEISGEEVSKDQTDDPRIDQAVMMLRKLMDLRKKDWQGISDDALRSECTQLLQPIVTELFPDDSVDTRQTIEARIVADAVGLGPLEALFEDTKISEIMVNRYDQVFIERDGICEQTALRFAGEDGVRAVIDRIVSPLGRRIDDASPMVDARLPDGSRVNAVIPPLSVKGACMTIRRFSRSLLGPDALVAGGSAIPEMMAFLKIAVENRSSIVVSGGTGSGKTTLLNLLSQWIPSAERIITIEDAAELRLSHTNLVSMEVRQSNAEGQGQVTIRDLLRNSLRMRPDRIIVGECRGGEALDMLQAMNTGHEGSLTTVHANSARDALSRLEVMVLMAGFDLPLVAIREQIASAVDIVIQQQRCADGRRRIVSISEVSGVESGVIQTQEIFRWRPDQGRHEASGMIPLCLERLSERGIPFDAAKILGLGEEAL